MYTTLVNGSGQIRIQRAWVLGFRTAGMEEKGWAKPGGCSSPVKVPSVGRRRPPNRRLVATRESQSAREGGARDGRTEREREYIGGNWTGEQKQAAG